MTGHLLYPRLTDRTALKLCEQLLDVPMEDVHKLWSPTHPSAYYAAVGGTRASQERLVEVREAVLDILERWLDQARSGDLNRSNRGEMDGPLGKVLHRTMGIVPSDAAQTGVWSFMTLVLLPEVAKARFPDGHLDRWLGRPRNALRRTWWREHVLGEVNAPEGASPLGEDEMVNLFERPTLASDARLVRALAHRVLTFRGNDRSAFTRRLARRVLADMAFTEIGLLSYEELEQFIEDALRARGVRDSAPSLLAAEAEPDRYGFRRADNDLRLAHRLEPTSRRLSRSSPAGAHALPPSNDRLEDASRGAFLVPPPPPKRSVGSVSQQAAAEASADGLFHQALVNLYERCKRDLDYDARRFIGMVANNGGTDTARQLLLATEVSEGFVKLATYGRLDLSVEAQVLLPPYRSLFTLMERRIAQRRLEMYGFDVDDWLGRASGQ